MLYRVRYMYLSVSRNPAQVVEFRSTCIRSTIASSVRAVPPRSWKLGCKSKQHSQPRSTPRDDDTTNRAANSWALAHYLGDMQSMYR